MNEREREVIDTHRWIALNRKWRLRRWRNRTHVSMSCWGEWWENETGTSILLNYPLPPLLLNAGLLISLFAFSFYNQIYIRGYDIPRYCERVLTSFSPKAFYTQFEISFWQYYFCHFCFFLSKASNFFWKVNLISLFTCKIVVFL